MPIKPWILCALIHGCCTISLNDLRVPDTVTNASIPRQQLPPTFLPLCGNGRLDTMEDYRKGAVDATFAGITPAPESLSTDITITATEVCDDGNRLDFDGCSADCMHMDLWVAPCELQTDVELKDVEALASMEDGRHMLISTATALYTLDITPSPMDRSVHTTLLLSKSFPLTDLFWKGDAIIAYSATRQVLYSLQGATLNVYLDLSDILKSSVNHAFHYTQRNLLVLHDDLTLAVVDLTSGQVHGQCTVQLSMDGSLYLGLLSGTDTLSMDLMGINARVDVTPSADGSVQCVSHNYGGQGVKYDIWKDAFEIMKGQMFIDYQEYNATAVINNVPKQLAFYEAYFPLGLWMEGPSAYAPRALLPGPINLASSWVGNPLVLSALETMTTADGFTCGSNTQCMLDTSPTYNLFSNTPLFDASQTWVDFLQTLLPPSAKTMAEIYSNTTLYSEILGQWSGRIASNGGLRAFAKDPNTGNMWAITDANRNAVYVLGKSGVQLRLPGSNKCMPPGVGICPASWWAPAGSQCMPCSQGDAASWAWSVQCADHGGRRRLLSSSSSSGYSVVEFSARGSLGNIGCLSSSVALPQGEGVWKVQVNTSDPAGCIREIMGALARGQILANPSVIVELSIIARSGGDQVYHMPVWLIVVIALSGLLVLMLIIGVVYVVYFQRSSQKIYHKV